MNVFYTNSNDLKNKVSELQIVAESRDCKVLGITETMFSSDIYDAEVSIPNFTLYRADRTTGKGGGSCIYVHNSITAHEVAINVPDCICVILDLESINIAVFVIYRAPSLSLFNCQLMLDKLSMSMNNIAPDTERIVMGDFNLPDVLWDLGVVNCSINSSNQSILVQRLFLEFFTNHNLSWVIGDSIKTRVRKVLTEVQSATLDNVLTSDSNIFQEFQIIPPLGKSDHVGIVSKWTVTNNEEYINAVKKNWAKAEPMELLKLAESLNWKAQLDSVDDQWKLIHNNAKIISESVPVIRTRVNHSGISKTRPMWDRSCLVKARKQKEKAWAVFENTPTARNLSLAAEKQDIFRRKQQQAMISFENTAAKQLKTNPKAFYSYMNSKRKIRTPISGLRNAEGVLITSATDIANELGTFFESTFVDEDDNLPIPYMEPRNGNYGEISDLKFSTKEVKDFLDKLNIWKSMGPDEIHPKLIRTLSNKSEFIYAITDLFQKCYDSGKLPAVWKQANITALHKKNEKSKASNYRPISLTCVLSKIFEKIVRNHILNHTAPMITTDQHGFLPRKSCVSNLLECMDAVSDILIRDGAADILYLDFQKAFDSVPHKRLLCKLRAYGITGKSLAIIREFLSKRTFRVRVGSTFSDTYTVSSGVPQGTVLGPLLFLLFINDLPDGIRSFVSLFADDLKLVTSCKESNIAQSDIDKLNRWENDWLLRFNVKDGKCKALHIGSKNPKVKYIMNGEILPQIESEKDLGVHTDNNLDWSVHIETCVNKANSMVGWVKRSLFCRNKFVMLNVYKTLIRPHIEYAVQAWNLPVIRGNWKHILLLEDVQRTFTRLIDGIGILPYRTRLKILQLTTLLERRMRGDLIETFKILSGKVDYGQTLFRVSRSGANILKDKRSDRILSNRVANYWNKIPQSVKDADTVSTFKARLEKYKKETVSSGVSSHGHFWELSEILLSKIDNDNHDQCAEFMINNPAIAKFKGINIS